MPLAGNQLSYANALAVCYAQGWRGAKRLITAVAVMCAESGRYARAYHVNLNGSIDRGLFQINSIHTEMTEEEAFDPRQNAAFALRLFKAAGEKFSPWYAYTNLAHLKFIPAVTTVYLRGHWRDKVSHWTG